MRMYVHGGGRTGRDAFPSAGDGLFPVYDPVAPAEVQAAALCGDVEVVIAHSWGAIAALRAIDAGVLTTAALVLVEPALYDLARGAAAIERHIAMMTAARALAADGDLRAFWRAVHPDFFGAQADDARWAVDRPHAERFAALPDPWGHTVTMPPAVRVLVVTGGWNDEYEEIAAALVGLGARCVTLDGFRHRPQDHPDFADAVDAFVAAVR